MTLPLEAVGRTTRDWEGPNVSPYVQAALDAALQECEGDIEIDATSNPLLKSRLVTGVQGKRRDKAGMSKNSKESKDETIGNKVTNPSAFPQSRGLVPK
jgi:hypothetical protein